MKRWWALCALVGVLVLCGGALLASTAQARFYVPRHHHSCKTGFVRRHPRVRRHHHWVRQTRCVFVKHAKPTGSATAKVSYSTRVDPTFVQAPNDPLAVTYDYSADATQTAGTVSTDLATVGQLPGGVLDFYSATSPGGPEQLFCSISVGAAVAGGDCPITYAQTGTYAVTTEYIPTSASAVTETDQETINPYATTTTLTVTETGCDPSDCTYTASDTVTDQNGNPVDVEVNATNGQTVNTLVAFIASTTGQFESSILLPLNGSATLTVAGPRHITAHYGGPAGSGWSPALGYEPSASPAVAVIP